MFAVFYYWGVDEKLIPRRNAVDVDFHGVDFHGAEFASEEAFRGGGIAPGLNEDIEHNASLIDVAPQRVLHALDPDEDFVDVPFVAWSRTASASAPAVGETRREFLR
jgi:hypothetical protein